MYKGKILINAETAIEVSRIANLPFSIPSTKPNHEELNHFLSFLGLYALADGFLYDDTIPEEDLKGFHQAVDSLGINESVKPLEPLPEEKFYDIASKAVNSAAKNILEDLGYVTASTHPPKDEDIKSFFVCIQKMNEVQSEDERRGIIFEGYNKNTLGSKFLMGLAADYNSKLLNKLTEFVKADVKTQGDVVSVVISEFYTFFLLYWSSFNGAIYAAHPYTIERLREYKLWILEQLFDFRKEGRGLPERDYSAEDHDVYFPLMGLSIFMKVSDDARPKDLFGYASEFSSKFHLPKLQKEIITQQTLCQSEESLEEASDHFTSIMHLESLDHQYNYLGKVPYQILPASMGSLGSLMKEEKLEKALDSVFYAGTTQELFEIHSHMSEEKQLMGAISNFIDYGNIALLTVERKVNHVWR